MIGQKYFELIMSMTQYAQHIFSHPAFYMHNFFLLFQDYLYGRWYTTFFIIKVPEKYWASIIIMTLMNPNAADANWVQVRGSFAYLLNASCLFNQIVASCSLRLCAKDFISLVRVASFNLNDLFSYLMWPEMRKI